MFRPLNLAAFFTLVFAFAFSAAAQSAPVTGRVLLKKADGTTVPLAGAKVEAFQMEIRNSAPPDKTDKKGQFNFAGLKLGATYVLSISGPGAAPRYVPNVKAGNENIVITLDEGDGSSFTEAEVRAAMEKGAKAGTAAAPANVKPSEMTAEQKKQQAEYEAKLNEVKGKNEKALKVNEIVTKALVDGNAAYQAKNYDAAIAKYDEGIAADPDFAGSAPVLLNNKGTALKERAVITYNQNVKSPDINVKVEALKKVRADFSAAIDSFDRSVKVLKASSPTDFNDPKAAESGKMNALVGAKESFRLMAATEQVDETKIPIAKELMPQYIAAETDPVKKEQGRLILGDVYRVANDSDNAILAYREVLAASPDNLDAMAGLGLSLVNVGYINNDKTKLQEGANVLQKFASAAPDTNKYKADAVGLIETLKKEQNVTPVKSAGASKKKN
ncbi:MAG: hypothetical protein ACR2IH_09715 [Pyrinomonadaceae bacterium]